MSSWNESTNIGKLFDYQDVIDLQMRNGLGILTVKARATNISDDSLIVIPLDADEIRFANPTVGDSVKVVVANDRGLCFREARLGGMLASRGMPVFVLEPVDDWQRVQRRDAVRLNTVIQDAAVVPLDRAGVRPMRATIVDISAGGLQLLVTYVVALQAHFKVSFHLPNARQPIQGEVEVVRVREGNRANAWRVGARFVNLMPAYESQIVRFILTEQARRQRVES